MKIFSLFLKAILFKFAVRLSFLLAHADPATLDADIDKAVSIDKSLKPVIAYKQPDLIPRSLDKLPGRHGWVIHGIHVVDAWNTAYGPAPATKHKGGMRVPVGKSQAIEEIIPLDTARLHCDRQSRRCWSPFLRHALPWQE